MTQESYQIIDGIKCYAPEVAFNNADYPIDGFEKLYRAEEQHFWFKSRNRILKRLFGRFVKEEGPRRKDVLEIGCGTGYVLRGLAGFSTFRLVGAEIHIEGLKYARIRLPDVEFIQADATRLPFEEEFDAVGAFDVLEHIEDDVLVMRNVHRVLRENGIFLITVPQHKFLWSTVDERACHKRRYSKKELLSKLSAAGFDHKYVSSFVCLLLPAMAASRILKRAGEGQNEIGELALPRMLNLVFDLCMRLEELVMKAGVALPFGGSLVVVARKISAVNTERDVAAYRT